MLNKWTSSTMFMGITFTLSLALWSGLALAAPQGGEINSGRGDLSDSSNINQYSKHLDTSWESFDIGSNESVNINQPSTDASIAIRVRNGLGTQIDGTLTANGNVALINPAGVEFGAGSVVNVGGLLASASGNTVKALGSITANTGDIHLQSVSADAGSVFVGDAVEATSLQVKDGSIVLEASERVGVTSSATLSAGEILVGGDYQGKGSIANAQVTIVEKGAQLNAGDEGRVIVWSDGYTYFNGSVNAPDGFTEISGKRTLKTGSGFFSNIVTGTLLLDPDNVIIRTADASDPEVDQAVTANIELSGAGADVDYIIDPASILDYTGGDLIIRVSGNITVTDPIIVGRAAVAAAGSDPAIEARTAFNLELHAVGTVTISAAITTLGTDFDVRAGGNISVAAAINTGAGQIDLRSTGGTIETTAAGLLTSAGLVLETMGANGITIGAVIASANNVNIANIDITDNDGAVTTEAGGDIVINGAITVTSGTLAVTAGADLAINENLTIVTSGSIELVAGADITTDAAVSTEVVIEALDSITWSQGTLTGAAFLSDAEATIMVDETINFTYTGTASLDIAGTLVDASISVADPDNDTQELSGFAGIQALTEFSINGGTAALDLSSFGGAEVATDTLLDLRGVDFTLATEGVVTLPPLLDAILAKVLTLNVGDNTPTFGINLARSFALIGIERLEINSYIQITGAGNRLTLRVLTAPAGSNNLRLAGSLESLNITITTGGSYTVVEAVEGVEAVAAVPADGSTNPPTPAVPAVEAVEAVEGDVVIGTTGTAADAEGLGNVLLIGDLNIDITAASGNDHLTIGAANILTSTGSTPNDLTLTAANGASIVLNTTINAGVTGDDIGQFITNIIAGFSIGANITAHNIMISAGTIELAGDGTEAARLTKTLTANNNIIITASNDAPTASATTFHDLVLTAAEGITINGGINFSTTGEITATARTISLATTGVTNIQAQKITLTASNLSDAVAANPDASPPVVAVPAVAVPNTVGTASLTLAAGEGGLVISTDINTSGALTLTSGGSIQFEDGVATTLAGSNISYTSASAGTYRDANLTLTAGSGNIIIIGYIGIAATRSVDATSSAVTVTSELLLSAKGGAVLFNDIGTGATATASVVKGVRDTITIEVGTDYSGSDAILAPANFDSRPTVNTFVSSTSTSGTLSAVTRWGNGYVGAEEGVTVAAAPAITSARSTSQVFFYENPVASFDSVKAALPLLSEPLVSASLIIDDSLLVAYYGKSKPAISVRVENTQLDTQILALLAE